MEDSAATPRPTEVIQLESLDTSFAVRPDQESAARRRFMTLLATPESASKTGQSEVLRAQNTYGDTFALKRLLSIPADSEPFVRKGREAALFEEYRAQLAVSHLRGFPRLFGYGVTRDHEPIILMEWVEGPTLLEARDLLPQDDARRGIAVAAVASSLLEALSSTAGLDGVFVHRDISPRNIILRGSTQDVATGLAEGSVGACLIDFGSAVYRRGDEASFTVTEDIWRNATPEYAPPEMLAPRGLADYGQRHARAVDVYALSSVLFELYGGSTPFDVAGHPGESAYQLKVEGAPAPLEPRRAEDQPLVDAIMSGLATDPAERPSSRDLLGQVLSWQRSVGVGIDAPAADATDPMWIEGSSHLRIGAETSEGREAGAVGQAGSDAAPPATPATPATGEARADGTSTPATAAGHARGRRISRRGFVGIAAGAAAALALGGGAIATRGFGLIGPKDFGDYGWDELADLSAQLSAADEATADQIAREHGLLADDGKLRGDLTRALTLTDGTQTICQLVDYRHDTRSDGTGLAGLTFSVTTAIAERPMADAPMASGGWEQSSMRAWLASDGLALLPDDLAGHVVAVDKRTNNVGGSTVAVDDTVTSDALWLFSIIELGGERTEDTFSAGYGYLADILNDEGSQYRLWREQGATARSANFGLVRQAGDGACYWWLRSPSPDVSAEEGETWFNRVGTNGDPFHFAAVATGGEEATYVMPGFCI